MLVCLTRATGLCIEGLHLPVEDAVADAGRDEFFSAGSILQVRADTAHPLMAGMEERAPVFFDRGPVFRTLEGFRGTTPATYPGEGSPLLSGYLLGEDRMAGLAAAVDAEHGRGRVILLGFRPQWRGQPFGTFRVLFNALLLGAPGSG